MGILESIKKGGSMSGEEYVLGCKPIMEESTEGRIVWECHPKRVEKDKIVTTERPIKVIAERGREPLFLDTGTADEKMLSKVKEWIKRHGTP